MNPPNNPLKSKNTVLHSFRIALTGNYKSVRPKGKKVRKQKLISPRNTEADVVVHEVRVAVITVTDLQEALTVAPAATP